MDIKLPSGVFTPDSGGSGDSGPGCLVGLLVGLIVISSAVDSCSSSGAGEPTRLNYVTQDVLCAPSAQAFAEYDRLERRSFDTGETLTAQSRDGIAQRLHATILRAGSVVRVESNDGPYSRVTPQTPTTQDCLVNTGRLKMGWLEWVSWKWSQRKAAEQAASAQAARAEAYRLRWSSTSPVVVACLTGVHTVRYSGVSVERATAVDISRCRARGGQVSLNGPHDGIVFYSDGSSASNYARPDLGFMLAGPVGTSVTIVCTCAVADSERPAMQADVAADSGGRSSSTDRDDRRDPTAEVAQVSGWAVIAPVDQWSDAIPLPDNPTILDWQAAGSIAVKRSDSTDIRTAATGGDSVLAGHPATIQFQSRTGSPLYVKLHIVSDGLQNLMSTAESHFQLRDYQRALEASEAALRQAPGDAAAMALQQRIVKTMKILGVTK